VYQTTWIQILEDSMLIVAALKNSKYLFFFLSSNLDKYLREFWQVNTKIDN